MNRLLVPSLSHQVARSRPSRRGLQSALAQSTAAAAGSGSEVVSVTGTRIKSLAMTATSPVSPVSQISGEQLSLMRAVTVEDFSVKLPQLAGGVNSTSAGSDAFGAQTLDRRNLGQSRTLVLINGTRAAPFSIRNAVDVNFIMNDTFEGLLAPANYRSGDGGGAQYGVNFTDVASGNKFSVDSSGNFTTTRQTTDYTPLYTLAMPMERINASLFGKFALSGAAELYGRAMFSKIQTVGAPRSGQAPAVVNANYSVNSSNPHIPAQARPLLTFVNGVANVTIERSLSELGVKTATNDRKTSQLQMGLRGNITPALSWDVYAQTGTSEETIVVDGDGAKAGFAALVNSSDLFKLPAGAVGFALDVEKRRETGRFDYNPDLALSFNQGVEAPPSVPPFFNAEEIYGELSVPILSKLPFVQSLSVEGACRRSSYDKSVGPANTCNTDKLGLSWVVNDSLRLRATEQNVLREPNFGEFDNPLCAAVTRDAITGRIKDGFPVDLNLSMKMPLAGLTVNVGVDNLLDKKPPTPTNAGPFNTVPDTYNIMGRSDGLVLSYRF